MFPRRPLLLLACLTTAAGCKLAGVGTVRPLGVPSVGASAPASVDAAGSPGPQRSANPLPDGSPTPTPSPGATPTPDPAIAPPGERSLRDRPDEVDGPQIHLVYVVPSGATDAARDTGGQLERSIGYAQSWFAQASGGQSLRLDTYAGRPDISYLKLDVSASALGNDPGAINQSIRRRGEAAGFDSSHKIYLYYYEGDAKEDGVLGVASAGQAAVVFLQEVASAHGAIGQDGGANGYDMIAAHEVIHTLGHVAQDAPNRSADSAHVRTRGDLMYPGTDGTLPMLDPGHDDYFGLSGNRVDLQRSLFLTPAASNFQLPQGYFVSSGAAPGEQALAPLFANLPGDVAKESAIATALGSALGQAGIAALPASAGLGRLARDIARQAEAGAASMTIGSLADTFCAPLEAGLGTVKVPGGASMSATELAGVVREQLAGTSASARALAGSGRNAMGVGVRLNGADATVAVVPAKLSFELERLALGQGPFGVRTLSGRAKAVDLATVRRLAASIGTDGLPVPIARFAAAGTGADFVADVPGTGTPTLRFWFTADDESYRAANSDLRFDASAPLASALRAPASAYRLAGLATWKRPAPIRN